MILSRRVRSTLRRLASGDAFYHLRKSVIELKNEGELRKVFGWCQEPILDDPSIYEFNYVEDVNERRILDALALGSVVRNVEPRICVDIGTAAGHSAALMSVNAPQAQIYTINIPPEEILKGEGGRLTTIALEREEIGSYYRERGLKNINQILANTARWQPELGAIDIAFIDGSHDTPFVYNDTIKVLQYMQPGAFILWHDFNLSLVQNYHWINSVCHGVEKLISDGWLDGRIFHLRDSWTGIYRVP